MTRLPSLIAGAALALGLGLTAPAAQGQAIYGVLPDHGTAGQEICIRGWGFDGDSPRVFFTQEGSGKERNLDVVSMKNDEIIALIPKVPSGHCDVHFEANGKKVTRKDGYLVMTPSIHSVNPPAASPGDVVEIVTGYIGPKKGKVFIGGKKAKVLDWLPGGAAIASWVPPGPQTDLIRVKVPKKLPGGSADVEIKTVVGVDKQEHCLGIDGTTKKIGWPKIKARIDGKKFRAGGKKRLQVAGGPGAYEITALRRKTVLRITVPFDPANDPMPQKAIGLPYDMARISFTDEKAAQTWVGKAGDWSLIVDKSSGGQIGGHFEGVLKGPSEKEVEGTFVINLP